ncbi:MAG TPA: hypothetical protein VLI71_05420 [Gammaproteobacteria bacterium]|nr:hypothetical protein [Gammaproteobacteria bacterium]
MRPRRIVARLASFFVGAASLLSPVLAQQEPPAKTLAPLDRYVTTETLAQLAGFAARDRACLSKITGVYDLRSDYKSCVNGLRSTTYCDAEAADIADLQALIDGDPRLRALVGSARAVSDYAGARCAKPWPVPSEELLSASQRALLGQCDTVMPVLIAQAITLTRSQDEPSERYGLCRDSLGRWFILRNTEQLVRYRLRPPGPASRSPAPYEFGIESYFYPEEFVKIL